jgi:hypothetical protein
MSKTGVLVVMWKEGSSVRAIGKGDWERHS